MPAAWRVTLPAGLNNGQSLMRLPERKSGHGDLLIVCNGRIYPGPFTLPGGFDLGLVG
jgi:hypothetical protein